MDQSSSSQPTFELPQQSPGAPEVPGMPMAPEAPLAPSQERLGQPGNVPSAAPMQPLTPQPQVPPSAQQTTHLPTAVGQPAPPPRPAMAAADADLIEKEWVLKAKAIVEQTSRDPYVQNKEINKVKADYLQKRYNKTIPVTDK